MFRHGTELKHGTFGLFPCFSSFRSVKTFRFLEKTFRFRALFHSVPFSLVKINKTRNICTPFLSKIKKNILSMKEDSLNLIINRNY